MPKVIHVCTCAICDIYYGLCIILQCYICMRVCVMYDMRISPDCMLDVVPGMTINYQLPVCYVCMIYGMMINCHLPVGNAIVFIWGVCTCFIYCM